MLVARGDVRTSAQVAAAVKFIKSVPAGAVVADGDLARTAGVGMVMSNAEIEAAVSAYFAAAGAAATRAGATKPTAHLVALRATDPRFAFSDLSVATFALDSAIAGVLGSSTTGVSGAAAASSAAGGAATGAAGAGSGTAGAGATGTDVTTSGTTSSGEDLFTARDLPWAHNTPAQLEEQRRLTGGKIITRFPPEPNGYLHIGHAKAMNFSFTVAGDRGGETNLRYDDTNPLAEEKLFIDEIERTVRWLGHRPTRVTFTSDYFEQLYELAEELIRRGHAYVCHQSKDEMEADRKVHRHSPWRDRAPAENLVFSVACARASSLRAR